MQLLGPFEGFLSMTASRDDKSTAQAQAPKEAQVRSRVADFLALLKLRLNLMVLAVAGAGYFMASQSTANAPIDPASLTGFLLGLLLVAGASAVLNQVLERELDARMPRTWDRPLPRGRVRPGEGLAFCLAVAATGTAVIFLSVGWPAALLALATLAVYNFAYTPLKTRTALSTLVGAIPGAMPPVIGWVAAAGIIESGALALFAIMFVWQLVHVPAVGWIYRDQYAAAGMKMLGADDPTGKRAAIQVALASLILIPTSLLPSLGGMGAMAGPAYPAFALCLGVLLLAVAGVMAVKRTRAAARNLFIATLVYLPVLLTFLAVSWV